MADQDGIVALSVATAIPGLWGFLCPPTTDQGPYPDEIVRLQQSKAVAASLALGTTAALLVKKPWPFLVAVIMVVIMLAEYESMRRRPQPNE